MMTNRSDESMLIGALLKAPHNFRPVRGRVSADDFAFEIERGLFEMIENAHREFDGRYDASIIESAAEHGGLPGSIEALQESYRMCVDPECASQYAEIVKRNSVNRMIYAECCRIAMMAEAGDPPADLVSLVRELSVKASGGISRKDTIRHVSDYLNGILDKIESNRGKGAMMGLRTGIVDLDQKTTGFHPGELIIIAARPGMGKTTLALNVLRNMADAGEPALMFSLEMTGENLTGNIAAAQGKIAGQKIRSLELNADDLDRFVKAFESLHSSGIYICDLPAMRIDAMHSAAHEYRQTKGIKAVIVDYLQLARADGKGRSREQEVGEISRGLKLMAKDLGVPVFALAQLNRQSESRQGGKPMLSDLRESGSIEQDADCVLLLHRPEYYDQTQRPGEIDIIIAKQRNGPTGEVTATFQGQYYRIDGLASPRKGYEPDTQDDGF